MKNIIPIHHKINMQTWPRREHFEYYRDKIKCGYAVTTRVDVTHIYNYAKSHGYSFYGCFIYIVSKTVNSMDEMKMMITPDKTPGIWEEVHPTFTIFHDDDKTFSDLWTTYYEDFETFYEEYQRVISQYGQNHGIKARDGQPANFYCISCVPWLDYTGYSTFCEGEPNIFPIITYGKFCKEKRRYTMPVTLCISHAAADGYHTSLFFEKLQNNLDQFF